MAVTTGQRRRVDRKSGDRRVVRMQVKDRFGNPKWITGDLIDHSEIGISVSLMTALQIGSRVMVRLKLGDKTEDTQLASDVKWCDERQNGRFHAGLEFLDGRVRNEQTQQQDDSAESEVDFYEIMQLSPNANAETIDRVYRMLAQRYHPDNGETGNSELFVQLSNAYEVLRDPERRAAYDANHRALRQLRWKIFDQNVAFTGREAEMRKRRGILSLLYTKMLHDPDHGTMSIRDFEELLGCPREHLQSALWYLKGKGFVQRSDNGRFTITVEGFDEAERDNPVPTQLLESGKQS